MTLKKKNKKVMGKVKKVKREKDTRTDAEKMADATGPRKDQTIED